MSVDAASDGDDVAFDPADEAEKVRRLDAVAPMVRAICASRLRRSDSDDAAQAVLEQVWRAQHQQAFADEESVRRYAATVARVMPASVDRRSVRAAPVGSVAEALWVDEAAGPAERFDRTEAMAEAAEKVAALLEQLTPREREVIRKTHLGERSTADAAAELGLTPSGVRSAQTRAMARMRESMDVVSTNPLASGLPERERRRAFEQRAGRGYSQGRRSAPVIEAAERFASAEGRPPSRSELVGLTGASNGTAQRVIRALRDQQETRRREAAADRAGPTTPDVGLHDHRPAIPALGLSRDGRTSSPRLEDDTPTSRNDRLVDEHEAGQQLELIPVGEPDGVARGCARPAEREPDPEVAWAPLDAQLAVDRARGRAAEARLGDGAVRGRAGPGVQPLLWDDHDGAGPDAAHDSDSTFDRDQASDAAGP